MGASGQRRFQFLIQSAGNRHTIPLIIMEAPAPMRYD